MIEIDPIQDMMQYFHFEMIVFIMICIIAIVAMIIAMKTERRKIAWLCLMISIAGEVAVCSGMAFFGVLADNGANLGSTNLLMFGIAGILAVSIIVEGCCALRKS